MRREDEVRLRHMLDHAVEASKLAAGHIREDLDTNRTLNLALVRLVEIIGEAAARVTPEARGQLPELPWLDIIGMRNRVIHGYDSVDFDILWDVIELHLPLLIASLQKTLR